MKKILEKIGFELINGLPVCKLRAKIIRNEPLKEEEISLVQERCYSWCNSTCLYHPDYGQYI